MDQENPGQQYLQYYLRDISFPADKEQIVGAAQNSGAPEDMVSQLQNNLPSGEYSDFEQVASNLQ